MNGYRVGKSEVGGPLPLARSEVRTPDVRPLTSDSRARTARLRRAIADLRAAGSEDRHGSGHSESIDLTPKSAHEAITRQMVTDLAADVAEIKSRVNAVLWLVASAVAVDVVMRLAGVG
jgi:hypothetical protein